MQYRQTSVRQLSVSVEVPFCFRIIQERLGTSEPDDEIGTHLRFACNDDNLGVCIKLEHVFFIGQVSNKFIKLLLA